MGHNASAAGCGRADVEASLEAASPRVRRITKRSSKVARRTTRVEWPRPPSDEEFIILPPAALAALAKLQDPSAAARVASAGATPRHRRQLGCERSPRGIHVRDPDAIGTSEEAIECLGPGKCRPRDAGRFQIYEDPAPVDDGRGVLLLPSRETQCSSAACSPVPHERSPRARAAPSACPVAPPSTPTHGVVVPEVVVHSTPPGDRCADSSSLGVAPSSPPRRSEVAPAQTPVRCALSDAGNRQVQSSNSWRDLVQLSAKTRGHAENKVALANLAVAQTPPTGFRIKGRGTARMPKPPPSICGEENRSQSQICGSLAGKEEESVRPARNAVLRREGPSARCPCA